VHVESPALDTQKARDFWGGLFGLKFEQYHAPSSTT
jgi:predicted enzyme related to lactoylglutathione lyase